MTMKTSIPSLDKNTRIAGLISSLLLAVVTVITFSLAITAFPIVGPYCTEGCIEYPYLDAMDRYPKDYLWMYPALLLLVSYLVFMSTLHGAAAPGKKVFTRTGLSFAVIATGILFGDYFVQFSVGPISMLLEETEGLALFTQYNPHGTFIALEEAGYLAMVLSFIFMASALSGYGRLGSAIRWIFMAGFGLTVLALVLIAIRYGLYREYRFEVAAISITWLTLIVTGILSAILFHRCR